MHPLHAIPARRRARLCPRGDRLGCGEDVQSPTAPESATPALARAAAGALAFSQIAVGGQHTWLTADAKAYCWGYGVYGQLGNGTDDILTLRPSPVAGGLHFAQLSAGTTHICGVTTDDRAYCWGENYDGRLGDGTTTYRLAPVAVAGGRHFRQIRAGAFHTCAVTPLDVAFCWGSNGYGRLGDGTTTQRLTPVRVLGGLRFRRVLAGGLHTCGVTTDDRGYCWGIGWVFMGAPPPRPGTGWLVVHHHHCFLRATSVDLRVSVVNCFEPGGMTEPAWYAARRLTSA